MKKLVALILTITMLVPLLPVYADGLNSQGYLADLDEIGYATHRADSVFASGNQTGNTPENVFDGSLATKWAHDTNPCSLSVMLEPTIEFDSIGISFTNGSSRKYNFEIEITKDGIKWEKIFSGKSCGNSNDIEVFSFGKSVSGSILRYVGNGSDTNQWNNINEITHVPVAQPNDDIKVLVEGNYIIFDVKPIISQDRVLVPMRGVCEALGADVAWDDVTQTVTMTKDKTTVNLTINKTEAYIDGEATELDVPAQILNGRTLVPLRFVSEALDCDVDWYSDSRKVVVARNRVSKEVRDALAEFEKLYDGEGQLDWKTKLFDPDTGGFYWAISSVKNEGFGPHLESTACISFNYAKAPAEIREKAGKWVQSLQDPETGYFIEPEYRLDSVADSKKGRDLSWALNILAKCGMEPLYKTPTERAAEAASGNVTEDLGTVEDFLTSQDKALAWVMNEFDWETARGMWRAGNTLDGYFLMMKKLGYAKPILEFIATKQNPETGMWGPEITYEAVSGAAKFSNKFSRDTIPYPNLDKLYGSVLELMETGEPENIVQTYNLIYTMYNAKATYDPANLPEGLNEKLQEILPAVIKEATEQVALYKKPDGAFGYGLKGQPTAQGAVVSLGLNESDVGGNALALTIRNELYQLAGLYPPALYDDNEWIRRCAEKEPITEPYVTLEIENGIEDFEKYDYGATPDLWKNATIVEDPDNSLNKALKISKTPEASFKAAPPPEAKRTALNFSLMVGDVRSGGSIFWVPLGDGLNICINLSGESVSLSTRATGSGLGETIGKGMETFVWSDVRIEYEPDGVDNTITKMYINGKLTGTSKIFWTGGKSNVTPGKNISTMTFTSFLSADADIYLDNLSLEYDY